MKKNFNEIYNNVYTQTNSSLEVTRKNQLKKGFILILIIILGIIFVETPSLKYSPSAWFILSVLMMIDSIAIVLGLKKYNQLFKENIIRTFVSEYDEKFIYIPNGKISSFEYILAEFERFDCFYSEDYIKGVIDKNINVEIAEISTKIKTPEDKYGDRKEIPLFHGIFATIDLPKKINGKTKIKRSSLINEINNSRKIEMDSSEFEKYFDVESTNRIETMQILTADVMEKLIDFREKNKIKFEITIKDRKIYIRFFTGEMFEAKLFKKALDYSTLLKYYEIINLVCDISKDLIKIVNESNI